MKRGQKNHGQGGGQAGGGAARKREKRQARMERRQARTRGDQKPEEPGKWEQVWLTVDIILLSVSLCFTVLFALHRDPRTPAAAACLVGTVVVYLLQMKKLGRL